MKCKKCGTSSHTCSNCELNDREQFAFYDLGVCLKCFDAVGGTRELERLRDLQANDEAQTIKKLKSALFAPIPAEVKP